MIKLTWQDRNSDETGFKIYRCKITLSPCTEFKAIKTTKPNTTSIRLPPPEDFTVGSSYYYRVTALKDQEESLSLGDMSISF